tara:strand:- start:425 stop:898 length:474 start_codon:yes stop_codon:yes gene_type:complete
MAFKLNDKILSTDVAFTSNGINYPANWLRLTTLSEKQAIGISEVADPATYDERFYDSPSAAKDLAELKTDWVKIQKDVANGLLAPYDWYVTRKAEKGTAIPTNVATYRDAVRTACTTREGEINGAADVAALKTLIDGTFDSSGNRTAGITLWPVNNL